MKWFSDSIEDVNELRSEYKKLLRKYHPDNNLDKDTTSIIQEINHEYECIFSYIKEGFEHSKEFDNYSPRTKQSYDWTKDKQMREMIYNLCQFPNVQIEVCGVWIYVWGETYPYKKQLKELGLTWNRNRKCWIIHWDDGYKYSPQPLSMNHIREIYGSTIISKMEDNLLQRAT